jgi:hypothetical protein
MPSSVNVSQLSAKLLYCHIYLIAAFLTLKSAKMPCQVGSNKLAVKIM